MAAPATPSTPVILTPLASPPVAFPAPPPPAASPVDPALHRLP